MRETFHSTHHPGDTPRRYVIGEALVRPVAACVLPVMIGATASVLEWHPIWPYMAVGLPTALVAATAWTHFTLSWTPATLHLRANEVGVQSVAQVLYGRPPQWHPLLDARLTPNTIHLTVGLETVTLKRADWPEFDALQDAVRRARQTGQSASSHAQSSPHGLA